VDHAEKDFGDTYVPTLFKNTGKCRLDGRAAGALALPSDVSEAGMRSSDRISSERGPVGGWQTADSPLGANRRPLVQGS